MGRGSYTAADWNKLKNSRNIASAKNEKEIFKSKKCDQRFDPKYIQKREARDSEDHPESLPIIIGLDVTASMGYLAEKVAKEALNETMMKLYSIGAVKDPALMFAAYGDIDDADIIATGYGRIRTIHHFRLLSLNLISVSQSSSLICGLKTADRDMWSTTCSGTLPQSIPFSIIMKRGKRRASSLRSETLRIAGVTMRRKHSDSITREYSAKMWIWMSMRYFPLQRKSLKYSISSSIIIT